MALDHKIRIIGGFLKGRKLEVIDLEGLRPTTDRARETLFNWIGPKVQGAVVLDLFAGSGALGFEAYSRGAKSISFVEKDQGNAAVLKSAIKSLPAKTATGEERTDKTLVVHCLDALKFLEQCPQGQGFDLIFLDPPFASDLLEPAVKLLVERELLNDQALVYVEMSKTRKIPLFGLEMIRDEVMGASHCGLYKKSFFI